MKHLLTLAALAAFTLGAAAQTSFTNNQGGLSLVFYVTNLPPALQVELENTFWIRHKAVATTNANGTVNPKFLASYAFTTNYVPAGTGTNGETLFAQVVTTNTIVSRQAFLGLIAAPRNFRVPYAVKEIIQDWCGPTRREIGDRRNEE